MKNAKLIRFLAALTPEELKSFQLFAQSPYHNSNKQVAGLLACLAKYHPDFDHKQLNKQSVFRKIHEKGKRFHEGRMNLLMARLMQLLKDFLVFEEVKKNAFLQRKERLHAYRARRLDDEYWKEVKKQEETLETWQENEKYYLEQLFLNREIFHHPATPRHQVGMPSLEKSLESLDMFFLWEKLKLSVAAFNRNRILKEKNHIELLPEIKLVFQEKIKTKPALLFYQELTELLQKNKDEIFQQLIDKYKEAISLFSDEEKISNLIILINYAAQRMRVGIKIFNRHSFNLYVLGLENKLLLEDGAINDTIFTNITLAACLNSAFDWADNFINEYKNNITPPAKKHAAAALAMAYLHYYKAIDRKNNSYFSEAINFINNINTNDPFYYYRIKLLGMKIHYEYYLQNPENSFFLSDFCNAFERQLNRDKTMGTQKKSAFINSVKILKKIIAVHDTPDLNKKKKEKILDSIIAENNLFGKDWLLEKARELKTVP